MNLKWITSQNQFILFGEKNASNQNCYVDTKRSTINSKKISSSFYINYKFFNKTILYPLNVGQETFVYTFRTHTNWIYVHLYILLQYWLKLYTIYSIRQLGFTWILNCEWQFFLHGFFRAISAKTISKQYFLVALFIYVYMGDNMFVAISVT